MEGNMYKTVIFDLDGTLLNTLEDLRDSTNYALGCLGYPERNLEEIRTFVGNGIRKLIERAVPEGTAISEIDKVFDKFRPYYMEHSREKTCPYDGIMEVLDYLKKNGYQMAIVSNKSDAAVKDLAKYYFGNYISVAIGEREGINRKPAPDSVFEAMRLLNADAKTSVYVGDSDVDRQTAANAGLTCVSVTWGFRDGEELRKLKPQYIIREPKKLIEIVKG